MCLDTTEKDRPLPVDVWHPMVDARTDKTTRRNCVLYYDENSFTRFEFQFHLNDTAIDFVVMYICVVISLLGIIGNFVTMAKIMWDSKHHTPTFAAIGYLALPDFFSVISLSVFYFTNIFLINELFYYFSIVDNIQYFSCSGHMLLLSIVGYLITVHPLHSRQYLTVKVKSIISNIKS